MSTHYYISRIRKGIGLASLALLSVLGVLGIAMQALLFSSSPVLAFAVHRAVSTPSPENVARAGVSVVRLLVTYTTGPASASTAKTEIQCTGLGVIITSRPSQGPADQNTWVLTDGALVHPDGAVTCESGTAHPKATLTSVLVLMSSAYNEQSVTFLFPTSSVPLLDVRCSLPQACQDGPALFAFPTDRTLPFIDLTPANSVNVQSSSIELSKSAASLAIPPPSNADQRNISSYANAAMQFITPFNAATGTPPAVTEPGMPSVDAHGQLVSIHLKSGTSLPAQAIPPFLKQQPELQNPPSNPVHDHWNAGITAFYQGPSRYSDATTHFNAVLAANSQFQGAQTFVQLMTSSPGSTSTPVGGLSEKQANSLDKSPTGGEITFFGLHISVFLLLVVAGVLVLSLVVLGVALFVVVRRRHRRAVQEEFAEAERIASATLEEEMRKQAWAQQQKRLAEQPTLTPETAPYAFHQPITSPLPCPQCQQLIRRGITRCPHCGTSLLSPSTDSGSYPRAQFVTPPNVVGRPNGLEDQPTKEMSPSMQQLSPSGPRNGLTDPEKTHPGLLRQGQNQNLGFSVVTRTDVGRKRKHKPNEDSLFAAQGMRDASSAMQQVGLFVVADGMGGHANGQDASQLAIQTIINFVLPKLAQSGTMVGEAFLQLLKEGVQCANLAVHNRNMEQRADMGTTMTATLVVAPLGITYTEDDTRPPAATAYIANVGDSRTYLYRKTRGLVKLTNDHSVVASLVEAGIIRPDDIYTHPKRNQIYRSLGEKPSVEVDSFVVPLEVDDKLLLCSDGLWDMVRDPQIEEVLKSYAPDPSKTGDMLIQAALDGGGEDNVSVIVVHIPDLSRQNTNLGIQLIDKPGKVQMPQL